MKAMKASEAGGLYDCDRGNQVGEDGGKMARAIRGANWGLCTLLDKRGKSKKISLFFKGEKFGVIGDRESVLGTR